MHPPQTVLFVLAILLLSYAEVINMNDDSSTSASDSNSTQQVDTKTSISLAEILKSKNKKTQGNKTVNTSLIQNQNIIMSYEQYLKMYKPEKYKKLNEFQNERQQSQYILGRSTYQNNIQYINKFNQNSKNTYKMGINSYTDIDPIKYKSSLTTAINQDALILKYGPLQTPSDQFSMQKQVLPSSGIFQYISKPIALRPTLRPKNKQNISIEELNKISIPLRLNFYITPDQVTIDWRNISGKVNFQGRCNACYAFSVTDSLYTTLRIQNKTVSPFSAQQIISCIKEYINKTSDGCIGGLTQQVYLYIHTYKLGFERDYPYSDDSLFNNVPGKCNQNLLKNPEYLKNKYSLYNYNSVQLGYCHEVANLLKKSSLTGVLKIDQGFLNYKSGVFENLDKINQIEEINHATAIVGYDHIKRAFIIKNSWDRSWGQNGFGYVHMSTGICASVYYPIIN